VPALACDAGCAAGARAATLATAFGVDRDLHVPVFERAAAPDYDATMLAYAWHNRDEVAGLEGMLADFVADRAAARRSAPPAPDAARKLLHQLAPFYGLASQSFGTGARRHVELFKAGASRAVVPAVPLSTTANRLTREDVEAATRSAAGYPLVLADVAPGADLDTLLQRFRGQCALEGPWDDGAAVARFRAAGECNHREHSNQCFAHTGLRIRPPYRRESLWATLVCRGGQRPQNGTRPEVDPRGAMLVLGLKTYLRSNRSRFMTLSQAATKSVTNFCSPPAIA
jgi:hypothetical protein